MATVEKPRDVKPSPSKGDEIDLSRQKDVNPIPSRDGEVNLYRYLTSEGKPHRWFDHDRQVIFVNGMLNKAEDHRESALALSALQNCPVIGVNNGTRSFGHDLGQCVVDKATFAARVRPKPGQGKLEAMESYLSRNPAALSLFRVLRHEHFRDAPLFAHSQGNLISSNALSAVAAVDGDGAIKGREVFSYGSPCATWPKGIIHHNFAFTLDPIGWLSLGDTGWLTFSNVKIGFRVAHGFLTYVEYDAEFVINACRWGGLGLTFRMDEKKLAANLVRMGANGDRILAVFQRLSKAHNSDVDDVALLYVNGLRSTEQGRALLRELKLQKPQLIALLIRSMTEGWTSAKEKECIAYLRTL